GSVALIGLRLADEQRAIRSMPWGVIVMVCGVSVLAALLEQTGGADRLAELVARVATPHTAPPMMALLCGLVSVYSSTTGVVLPAFLPLVPGLVARLGGGDALLLASAVVVGGNIADASPLSTIGALCWRPPRARTDDRCSTGCSPGAWRCRSSPPPATPWPRFCSDAAAQPTISNPLSVPVGCRSSISSVST
ncbi:MAG TPA: SLC13 family permease, partial [Gemmataceae bacterium]|nr:SLC13 family permease [Gemmataceae bacterium]